MGHTSQSSAGTRNPPVMNLAAVFVRLGRLRAKQTWTKFGDGFSWSRMVTIVTRFERRCRSRFGHAVNMYQTWKRTLPIEKKQSSFGLPRLHSSTTHNTPKKLEHTHTPTQGISKFNVTDINSTGFCKQRNPPVQLGKKKQESSNANYNIISPRVILYDIIIIDRLPALSFASKEIKGLWNWFAWTNVATRKKRLGSWEIWKGTDSERETITDDVWNPLGDNHIFPNFML